MSEAANGQTPAEAKIAAEAEERRKKLAEAVTNVAAIVESDPNMITEEKKVWQATAEKPLNALAENQANSTTNPETIGRAAGLLKNDMEKPGPSLIKRVIDWAKKNL